MPFTQKTLSILKALDLAHISDSILSTTIANSGEVRAKCNISVLSPSGMHGLNLREEGHSRQLQM